MWGIDFDKMINDLLDDFARTPKRVNRIKVAVNSVKALYNKYVTFQNEVLTSIQHTGQIMYLEKRLNDKWDAVNRGIYIDSNMVLPLFYIFKKGEPVSPVYIYKKFNSAHLYQIGEYAIGSDNILYECGVANTTSNPVVFPANWAAAGTVSFLKKKTEFYGSTGFTVQIPQTVVFDLNEVKAVVNYYKQAGKTYTVNTY